MTSSELVSASVRRIELALSETHRVAVWLTIGMSLVLACALVARISAAFGLVGALHELDYGEPIVYAQAGRLLRGEPLYQPIGQPPYTVVAYTPIYYGVVATARLLFPFGFAAGRLVSMAALAVMAVLVALLASRHPGNRATGVLAALLFVVLGFPGTNPWYVLYKEDLLGAALSCGAVSLLVGQPTRRRLALAGMLAGLGMMTKQSFVAAPLTAAICLWGRDRAGLLAFFSTFVGVVAGSAVTFEVLTHAFFANTLLANVVPFSLRALRPTMRTLLLYQGGALIVAAWFAIATLRRTRRGLTDPRLLYWLASSVSLVGLAKVGSNSNYWIELAAATSILVALAIGQARRELVAGSAWRRLAPLGLLLVNVAVVVAVLGTAAVPVISVTRADTNLATNGDLEQVVARVRNESHDVLADPLDVVALAGRDIVLEPYLFNIFAIEGRWDSRRLVNRICDGAIGLLVLKAPETLESDGPMHEGYYHWPISVLRALRQTLALDSRIGDRLLYTLSPAMSTARAAADVRMCEDWAM